MVGSYDVYFGGHTVGRVRVARQGLYTTVSCRCGLPSGKKYDLYAQSETGKCALGLLYTVEGCFGMDTRIPVKELGQGSMNFWIEPRREFTGSVLLQSEIPTSVLLALEYYRFLRSEGKPCLILLDEKND